MRVCMPSVTDAALVVCVRCVQPPSRNSLSSSRRVCKACAKLNPTATCRAGMLAHGSPGMRWRMQTVSLRLHSNCLSRSFSYFFSHVEHLSSPTSARDCVLTICWQNPTPQSCPCCGLARGCAEFCMIERSRRPLRSHLFCAYFPLCSRRHPRGRFLL